MSNIRLLSSLLERNTCKKWIPFLKDSEFEGNENIIFNCVKKAFQEEGEILPLVIKELNQSGYKELVSFVMEISMMDLRRNVK